MSLAAVTSRYEAASLLSVLVDPEQPAAVEHHELAWSDMHTAVRLTHELRRATADGVSRPLEDLVVRASEWCRVLGGAPLAPGHPAVGTTELLDAVRAHGDSGLDSVQRSRLEHLAGVIGELSHQPHPASACLEAVISRYGRSHPADPPAVYLAAEPHQTQLVRRWLAEEELDAEVCPVSNLREATVREAVVLLGPPTRYFSSPWCPPRQAARRGGWLVTASPARHVHVVTWPGHPHFDIDTANAFPNTVSLPVIVDHRGQAGVERTDEPIWLPPAPVEPRIKVTAAWRFDRDPVLAVGLRLAGGAVTFYGPGTDPVPEVVTWDTASVQLLDTDVSRITVGTALLFRPTRSAVDNELHRRADELLVIKYGPAAPAAAKEAKQELKYAYATSGQTDEQLVCSLTSKLDDSQYARHIVNRLSDPGYIAPEKPGAYGAVRSVLRLPKSEEDKHYALLRSLRGACRRAGIEIARDLMEVLRTTNDWQADLECDGVAAVSAGALLGRLDLRIVTAVDPARRAVGRSRIGRVILDCPVPATNATDLAGGEEP